MIESIEKLREWLDDKIAGFDDEHGAIIRCRNVEPNDLYDLADEIEREIAELQASWAQEAREHADDSARLAELARENAELKREIAERYMELPVDADGVPIHVGDYLEAEEFTPTKRFHCLGFDFEAHKSERWSVCMSFDEYSGTSEYTSAARCHHVKKQDLEDVLESFIEDYDHWDEFAHFERGESRNKLFAKYAALIRELLGVKK